MDELQIQKGSFGLLSLFTEIRCETCHRSGPSLNVCENNSACHISCNSCLQIYRTCPICWIVKNKLVPTYTPRIWKKSMAAIANSPGKGPTQRPCCNKGKGCQEIVVDVPGCDHESRCFYRDLYIKEWNTTIPGSWDKQGIISALKQHGKIYWVGESREWPVYSDREKDEEKILIVSQADHYVFWWLGARNINKANLMYVASSYNRKICLRMHNCAMEKKKSCMVLLSTQQSFNTPLRVVDVSRDEVFCGQSLSDEPKSILSPTGKDEFDHIEFETQMPNGFMASPPHVLCAAVPGGLFGRPSSVVCFISCLMLHNKHIYIYIYFHVHHVKGTLRLAA